MTVSDLIKAALLLMEDISPGYTPSADTLAVGLETANGMLDILAARGVLVPTISSDAKALTGVNVYTWGTGGTINSVRPLKILSAEVTVNQLSNPVEIITQDRWSKIDDKSAAGPYADVLFPDYNFPLCNIFLWPTPANGGILTIYSLKQLASFLTVNDNISLPPGYTHALTYILAPLLAPKLRRQVTDFVIAEAKAAHDTIAALNMQVLGTGKAA